MLCCGQIYAAEEEKKRRIWLGREWNVGSGGERNCAFKGAS
jgi:hypothetical protein